MNTNSAINAIVVEDFTLAREGLIEMLQEFSAVKIVGQAKNVDSAGKIIQELRPELIFFRYPYAWGNWV